MQAPTINAQRPLPIPTTIEGFLNRLRDKHGSDYAVAKALGIRQQAISNYRNKRTLPDDRMAIRLADEMGLKRDYVVACVNAERAAKQKDPTVVTVWRDMAEKLGVLCLVVVGTLQLAPALPDMTTAAATVERLSIMSTGWPALFFSLLSIGYIITPRNNNNRG